MATKDTTNQKSYVSFSDLKPYEQAIIVMRGDGKKWEDVAAEINKQFDLQKNWPYLRNLTVAGGRLYQAMLEYNEQIANQSVLEAKQLAKRLAKNAIAVLGESMASTRKVTLTDKKGKEYEEIIFIKDADRINAAKAIANKYVPDKQVIISPEDEAEVPAELLELGDTFFDEPTDNPTDSSENVAASGARPDESLPESLLSQSGEADPASSPTS